MTTIRLYQGQQIIWKYNEKIKNIIFLVKTVNILCVPNEEWIASDNYTLRNLNLAYNLLAY